MILGRHGDGRAAPDASFLAGPRGAGALLIGAFLVFLLALLILVANGAMSAFSQQLQGSLAPLAAHAAAFRWSNGTYAIGWVAELLGFVALTRLLMRGGQEAIPVLALAAFTVVTVLGVLEASFHLSLTPWAAAEAARTGSTPAVYTLLLKWVGAMQDLYLIMGFGSLAAYGWALLNSALVPAWLGYATLGWGLGFLAVMAGFGWSVPAVLFIYPPVIGGTLLALG